MLNTMFNNLKQIKLQQIKANPEQPRKYFDDNSIHELADSIKKCGVINPISVKKDGTYYQIIAGERRFRASRLAGLREIPCLVINESEENSAIISIVENIQRFDLNFIEEAHSYLKLMVDFGFKQEEIARKIGKTQSSVANKIRILKLGDDILAIILKNNLTERHARILLKINESDREAILHHIIVNKLNVAKTEEYIESILNPIPIELPVKNKQKYAKLSVDVRIFINSINEILESMKFAGINAKINKKRTDDSVLFTIDIPIKKAPVR